MFGLIIPACTMCGVRSSKALSTSINWLNVFVFVAITKETAKSLYRLTRLMIIKYSTHVCVFVSFPELIALHPRTLGGNVYLYTKLFNMMLNIWRRWHACRNALKTTPHTGGTCLRQLSRVTLSSADSSSVRQALNSLAVSTAICP